MAIPNQTPYNIFTANGISTVFPYEFYLLNAFDLTVSINGAELTSGFTISGIGNVDGGEVTFLTPPANGSVILLERVVPTYRLTEYQDNGDLLAETVNKDFDRLWMAVQQAFVYLGLALTRPLLGGPFNAKGYRIENLGAPVNSSDAATKGYVDTNSNVSLQRVLRVPEAFINPLPAIVVRKNSLVGMNDAGDPVPIFSMTDTADLALKLASSHGNEYVPTIGSNGYTPIGLDNTGTVDGNAIITAAFASHGHIRLPPGIFRLGQFTVPGGCQLEGSGRMLFNKATGQWEGRGTLIIGNADQTDCIGFSIKNLSFETFAGGNSIQGLSPRTGYGYIKNVAHRANNHGQLWEANDNNPMNTNAIGNIVIEDCVHYGGPNGFVTKHKNVEMTRCQAFDVETQSFVVVSDNVNYIDPGNHSLGRTYSRATQTTIRDCYHYNDRLVNTGNEGIRIYSRDYEPLTPSVIGVADVQISNFNGIGCAGNIIRAGEIASNPVGFSKVKSADILLSNMPYNVAPFACFRLDSVNRVQFDNCLFGNQVNVELVNNNNEQINFSKNNRIKAGATLLGVEKCILTVSDNASSLVPVAGQHIIDIRNTVPTSVTGISYAVPGKEHTILINDNVTVVNLGTPYRGYGTRIGVRYNGSSWDITSLSRKNTHNEFDRSSAVIGNAYDLQITSVGLMAHFINLNASLTTITASDVASYLTGNDDVTLRIRSNAPGLITIGGWSSTFKNVSTFTLDTTSKLILDFRYDGASLVLIRSTQYT